MSAAITRFPFVGNLHPDTGPREKGIKSLKKADAMGRDIRVDSRRHYLTKMREALAGIGA